MTLSGADKDYSGNTSCALNYIFVFIIIIFICICKSELNKNNNDKDVIFKINVIMQRPLRKTRERY